MRPHGKSPFGPRRKSKPQTSASSTSPASPASRIISSSAPALNTRQNQAISDEINLQLKRQLGELPAGVEGYEQGEWILSDYGDFLVHVFSPKAREYYSLERLWRDAKVVPIPAE